MRLYMGWNGEKFVLMVTEGNDVNKVLHRISLSKEEADAAELIIHQRAEGTRVFVDHQQMR